MGNQRRNTRSRSQKWASDRDDLLKLEPLSKKRGQSRSAKGAPADEEWQTLNAQIGALESFLTGASARADRQRRQRLENILPPLDRADLPRDHHRMSRWQERNHYGERQRHGVSFFLLFCAVCALLWWLLQTSASM
ncbi:MAG: hypothetical protein KDN20_12955 [Verrucomicrobiae bacterium]|nr:hypothetical protein [Verrucomicrobiae bacterium]